MNYSQLIDQKLYRISAVVACILYIFCVLVLFGDFKHRVLLMRKGKADFDSSKIGLDQTADYIGS